MSGSNVMQAAENITAEAAGGSSNAKEAAESEETYSKQDVAFMEGGGEGRTRCGNCVNFEGGTCQVVEGTITPDDVCNLFNPVPSEGRMETEFAGVAPVQKSMIITKVSRNRLTKRRTWHAMASGVKQDAYQERMSVGLFQDFIKRMEAGEKPPMIYRSPAWDGGAPYLSVAHYLDLGGLGIAGDVESVWVDGDSFKARGTFRDTPMGDAVFKAIDEDMKNNVPPNERVRISIAFLDMGHEHAGVGSFNRKSLTDSCPHCGEGIKGKVYRSGLLIHLAATRIPAYPEAAIEIVERADMTDSLRKKDAASIVGDELAQQLEAASAGVVQRADSAIVIKSENGEEAMEDKDKPKETEEERKKREAEEAKATEDAEKAQMTALSLGGALTLENAESFLERRSLRVTAESAFATVLKNIAAHGGEDTASLIDAAVEDYQYRVDIQSAKTLEATQDLLTDLRTRMAPVAAEGLLTADHPLAGPVDEFVARFDEVVAMEGNAEQKLMALQEPFNTLGNSLRESLADKPAPADGGEVAVLRTQIEQLTGLVTQLVNAQKAPAAPAPAAPVQRSAVRRAVRVTNEFTAQAPVTRAVAPSLPDVTTQKKSKIGFDVRRSVGLRD